MLEYAQIHIFDAVTTCGRYQGRLLLIFILHNVMHDITSTLPVGAIPSATCTQNGRPMLIAGGARSDLARIHWLCFNLYKAMAMLIAILKFACLFYEEH